MQHMSFPWNCACVSSLCCTTGALYKMLHVLLPSFLPHWNGRRRSRKTRSLCRYVTNCICSHSVLKMQWLHYVLAASIPRQWMPPPCLHGYARCLLHLRPIHAIQRNVDCVLCSCTILQTLWYWTLSWRIAIMTFLNPMQVARHLLYYVTHTHILRCPQLTLYVSLYVFLPIPMFICVHAP